MHVVLFSSMVKFISFEIGAIFFIALFIILLLLLIIQCHLHIAGQLYSQFCCFCPDLCSNCGHEDVQWVLETYYVHYDNHGHIDELEFLLIKYLKGTM